MNGTLYGFDKLSNNIFTIGEIENGYSMEDNINEAPSNLKVRITNTEKEEYQANTICYFEDTDTWWVIKSDTSTYINTDTYKHEIELVEGFEWFNYRHLPDCAFAQKKYTLEELFIRLFRIARLTCSVEYASFINKNIELPFFAFTNFTVASAIKQIAKSINAIPKLKWEIVSNRADVQKLYFISRLGNDETLLQSLNAQFPIAYEINSGSSEQFKTRNISNLSNVKSSNLVRTPIVGGHRIITPNTYLLDFEKAIVELPNKIGNIDSVVVSPVVTIYHYYSGTGQSYIIYRGLYIDLLNIKSLLVNYQAPSGSAYTDSVLLEAITLPSKDFYKISYRDELYSEAPTPLPLNTFAGQFTLVSQKEFEETQDDADDKDKMFYWKENSNQVVLPKDFFTFSPYEAILDDQSDTYTDQIIMIPEISFTTPYFKKNVFFAFYYQPIADIKVSYDNDYESQDERYYNQSGKSIDSFLTSKLILSDINDSVDGTKIRQARYYSFDDILPLGQKIIDNNVIYIITQRSVDYHAGRSNSEDGYYMVIYNLSRNRIARSENINADSNITTYSIPDDNLVDRVQLYKDYLELSFENKTNDTPYMSIDKTWTYYTNSNQNNHIGCDLNMLFLGRSELNEENRDFLITPSVFDLAKSKIIVAKFPDNNYIGQTIDYSAPNYLQTYLTYTDADGSVNHICCYFLDENDISENNKDFGGTNVEFLPFNDYPYLPDSYLDVADANGNYSIALGRIEDSPAPRDEFYPYQKDAFEIPIFEYQVQINDSYSIDGNININDNILETIKHPLGYFGFSLKYVLSPIRITNENAINIWNTYFPHILGEPALANNYLYIIKDGNEFSHQLIKKLTPSPTYNDTPFTNVGFYAVYYDGEELKVKYLYSINDYTLTDYGLITLYLNNWKI